MTDVTDRTDPAGDIAGAAAFVQEQATAFQTAKLILAGVELGLFTLLADGPRTEDEICERLGMHPRGSGFFLDALAVRGLLAKADGRYENSGPAATFLSAEGDRYLGGFLGWVDRVMYPAWADLTNLLRTGKPPVRAQTGRELFAELWDDPEQVKLAVRLTESISRPLVPALVRAFEWGEYQSVVDLGGCRGDTLARVVQAHPHLSGVVFDLPAVRDQFDEHVAELGVAARVRFHPGDFFVDPLPHGDVLTIGHGLVDWSEDLRRSLLSRTFSAVRPGGALLIWDPVIIEDEPSHLRNLLRGLNMQLMTPGGGAHRLADLTGWLRDAGYHEVTRQALDSDVSLVVARKAP